MALCVRSRGGARVELHQDPADGLLLLLCESIEAAADGPALCVALHPAGEDRQPQGNACDVEPHSRREVRLDGSLEPEPATALGEVDERTHLADHVVALIDDQAGDPSEPHALVTPPGPDVDRVHLGCFGARLAGGERSRTRVAHGTSRRSGGSGTYGDPMNHANLGPFQDVSRLTLGGGGLGQGWGASSEEEAVATARAALDAGINMIDTAPMYGSCEAVIANAFGGTLPAGVRITTKCQLGEPRAGTAAAKLEASLDASLAAMRLDRVDVFFLHSNICADDEVYAHGNDQRAAFATPWSQYAGEVVAAFEDLQRRGRIGAWGITGTGVPGAIIQALQHEVKPSVVQAITNVLDSAGGIRRYAEPARPREIIAVANAQGIGVMGIRAVQAGALTAAFDRPVKASHPEAADYERAAPFRALCAELGADPAFVAHQYALGMQGVDTVVLGVKNRAELAQCVEAEAVAMAPDVRARIDGLGLARV
jgi:aryl-alcohol dehydrogenase-like predicted oxidoreductase